MRRELRELLTSAVEMRLQSDVPLGAFLSGGDRFVDHRRPDAAADRREPVQDVLDRLSASPEYDETRYAREVARRFGTEHHEEFRVEPRRDGRSCRKLVWHYDEPFADSSAVPDLVRLAS